MKGWDTRRVHGGMPAGVLADFVLELRVVRLSQPSRATQLNTQASSACSGNLAQVGWRRCFSCGIKPGCDVCRRHLAGVAFDEFGWLLHFVIACMSTRSRCIRGTSSISIAPAMAPEIVAGDASCRSAAYSEKHPSQRHRVGSLPQLELRVVLRGVPMPRRPYAARATRRQGLESTATAASANAPRSAPPRDKDNLP